MHFLLNTPAGAAIVWPVCHVCVCVACARPAYAFALQRSNGDRSHHRCQPMLNLMDCCFRGGLVAGHFGWMAGFRRLAGYLKCDSSQCLGRDRHCFCFVHPKWFGQGRLDRFGHGHCDRRCLNFRCAFVPFSLQHSIFGHRESFLDSTGAEQQNENAEEKREKKMQRKITIDPLNGAFFAPSSF